MGVLILSVPMFARVMKDIHLGWLDGHCCIGTHLSHSEAAYGALVPCFFHTDINECFFAARTSTVAYFARVFQDLVLPGKTTDFVLVKQLMSTPECCGLRWIN